MRTSWVGPCLSLLAFSLTAAACDDGLPPPRDVGAGSSDGAYDDDDDDDGDDGDGDADDDADDDGDGGDDPGDGDPDDGDPGDDADDGGDDGGPKPPSGDGGDGDPGDDGSSVDDDGGTADLCGDNQLDLVPYGWADASSEFSGWFTSYPADLAIDGDVTTSWFSAGPGEDGIESTFEFVLQDDHCIDELVFEGNGAHEDTDFRTGYGYEYVTVEIKDTGNFTVFSEELELDGTPDPTLTIDTGGVLGHRVVLTLSGHESPDCGGFSELSVTGREPL